MAEIDFQALAAFFRLDEIEWRVQQAGDKGGRVWARCVPFVDNRAIMNRLDQVVGPPNWRNEYAAGPGGGVLCGLSIRVAGEWVTKWDGAENTKGLDGGEVKGGLSGAMKRAAVQWGIGRYLYTLGETFANVHDNGRFRGKTREGTAFRWDPPALPSAVLPPSPNGVAAHRNGASAGGELEQMLDFIRAVGAQVDEQAEIRIQRKARNLKTYVRENWPTIKEQPAIARTVVESIEAATGASLQTFLATGAV